MFTDDKPDLRSLELLLDAARMGWWKVDFRSGEVLMSDYLADLLEFGSPRVTIQELIGLTHKDHRHRIHSRFMALKVENHFDETFPVLLPEGEVWVHVQLVRKLSDHELGLKLFGYAQRVTVQNRDEAELLTLESNYHAVLRENQHMDELLDHLPIGYFRIRLLYNEAGKASDYLFLSINQTAQEILGVKAEEYIDKTAREIGIPVHAHIDSLAAIGLGDFKANQWYAHRTERHCRSFLYNTPNDETEIVILILDVTDTIRAHQALDEQEKLLRNIVQNAPIGIEIYDRQGHLIKINHCDLEMFGVEDPEKIHGLSIFDNPNFSQEIKTAILRGEGIDFAARYDFSKVGDYYRSTRRDVFDWTARLRCLYNDRGELTHYLLLNIDNTELRRTQNRLSEFETLFRMVSEYAQVGYANYDLLSKSGYAQSVWLRNYGEKETAGISDIIGRYNHIHPDDRKILMHALGEFHSGKISSKTVICRILHDDGRLAWIKTHLICRDYRPEAGIIDMLGINYDITALKQTEQELIAAKERAEQSDKLKSAFLANMSHEIRTPLNAIVGFSELLATEQDPGTRQEYIDLITVNNSLLLQIVSDVLDLARIESGRMEITTTEFDAAELCREVAETFRLQCRQGVVLRTADGLHPHLVRSYKQGLSQILGNFMRNSLKFTTEGSITIGFEIRPGTLRFYVCDTGIGIPADKLEHVFERFYKVDNFTQGTGLGLPICKSIAEQLGGTIGVDSTAGKGSCFRVDVPST